MNFSTPDKVRSLLETDSDIETVRSENRAKVNNLFNGVPPLSDEEAKRWNLKVNVNWGEGPVLAAHARRQYTNAFQGTQHFFTVEIPNAPAEFQREWGQWITNYINRVMKRNKAYFYLKLNQFASVVAHGVGHQLWPDKDSWLPELVAIEDFRVPTDTELSYANLPWFGIRKVYTEGQLARAVFCDHPMPGWDKNAVKKVLKAIHDQNTGNNEDDWDRLPEKVWENLKQNMGFYTSDKAPTVTLWHFYHEEIEPNGKTSWHLKVIPATNTKQIPEDQFLYKSVRPEADTHEHILHTQFGDLNNKAPFRYHSVRSLGFLLMEPCFWNNLMRCRLLQHVFEAFNIWLKAQDPIGRARALKMEFFDRAVIPEGVSVVPQTERHQIDPRLVETVQAQLRQLQGEAAASYTQNIDTGTSKEQTAFETSVKLSTVNAMMQGLLTVASFQEMFAYVEICRRFCLRKSTNADNQAFQKAAAAYGIPKQWLNVEEWDITPELPLGSGNPTIQMAEASQLMRERASFSPDAQQEILHDFALATTKNPRKAGRLVKIGERRRTTDAQHDAELAFGTLMAGGIISPFYGNIIDPIETFIGMTAGVISQAKQQGSMMSWEKINGCTNVLLFTKGLIAQLMNDQQQAPRAKDYADNVGKLENEIKGFAQRQTELEKKQAQEAAKGNGEAQKAQMELMIQQQKAQISAMESERKLQLQEKQFAMEERRKAAEFEAEQARKNAETRTDIDLQRQEVTAKLELQSEESRARIELARAEAAAKPEKNGSSED